MTCFFFTGIRTLCETLLGNGVRGPYPLRRTLLPGPGIDHHEPGTSLPAIPNNLLLATKSNNDRKKQTGPNAKCILQGLLAGKAYASA